MAGGVSIPLQWAHIDQPWGKREVLGDELLQTGSHRCLGFPAATRDAEERGRRGSVTQQVEQGTLVAVWLVDVHHTGAESSGIHQATLLSQKTGSIQRSVVGSSCDRFLPQR